MIQNPLFLALGLIALVAGILKLEKTRALRVVFHYLPAPFWCYFIPVSLASAGLLPPSSPVYTFLSSYVLGACLILLLLSVNLPLIGRVGPVALGAMAAGMVGIAFGTVVSYDLWAARLPPDTWKGMGALSASWTGGSANMLAVKEALQMSDSAFAPFVIVDTVMTYLWMGVMISLAPFQNIWDRWVNADRGALEETLRRLGSSTEEVEKHERSGWHGLWLLAAALALSALCLVAVGYLPKTATLSTSGWAFILASILGVFLSFTPASRLEEFGASKVGYFCLYLLLASIGARARFQAIQDTPLLFVTAILLVAIHAGILLLYGRWRRVPLFFLVVASQANIGGTASAPIVAGIYQPTLASLGLFLAIGANVVGTYIGLLIAHACHWVHP